MLLILMLILILELWKEDILEMVLRYAFEENFLKKYFVFGLHERFISKSVFNTIKSIP